MRFAAIADIHGNHAALQAVLEDIAALGIRDIVNLGDCFSGPLEAGHTADLLLLLDMNAVQTVRGNHDRYLLETPPEAMGRSDAHAHGQLAPRHFEWLRKLPTSMVWREDVFLCHATPSKDDVYWLDKVSGEGNVVLRPQAEIESFAEGVEQSLILCAHSHLPRVVSLSDGRMIVNPGSVGCPAYHDDEPVPHDVETGHPLASYVVLEKAERGWTPQFRTVAYDHMAVSRLAADNGRADWAAAIATGRMG
ncbi:metallophosphoesterase [Neorhizobium sp. JUb45]|uniref:metallophosphoesterase family protein n=1 Tax=unclassified Neorhizobium TaxID=2629175 RepID=UPI001050ECD2|nr:metallophosphoesterase [Neorhizobium sp. JUb45]TCR06694.1 Icc-related predicted phosphoesterase [Neorhizobium sp. JUb45]